MLTFLPVILSSLLCRSQTEHTPSEAISSGDVSILQRGMAEMSAKFREMGGEV